MKKLSGQALVSLLVVSTIFVLVVTGILITSLTTNQIGIWSRENQRVRIIGLSVLNLARVNLLRNPACPDCPGGYSGETLTLDGVSSIIRVSTSSENENLRVIEVDSRSQNGEFLVRFRQTGMLNPDAMVISFGKIEILDY